MDGVSKCFRLLGSPGDHFLADEFSFNALTNAPLSHGVNWVPVKIDKGGLIPSDLERIMSNWDEETQGRRPHVLYSVPYVQTMRIHLHCILTSTYSQFWPEPNWLYIKRGPTKEGL